MGCFCFPTGAGFFAAAGKFIDRGPSAGFRRFFAYTFMLVTGFDVCGLTLLFVSITGFIALRHGGLQLVSTVLLSAGRVAKGTLMPSAALKSIS